MLYYRDEITSDNRMRNEFEIIWMEAITTLSRHFPGNCLEELKEITESLSQDTRFHGRGSNGAPPE